MNWYGIKLAALRKLDPSVENTNPTRNTKDYLNAIVEAANRGLYDLATAGKFITKEIHIPNYTFDSLIDGEEERAMPGGTIEFEAEGRSYYLEVYGKAEIIVMLSGEAIRTENNPKGAGFSIYRGNVPNEKNSPLKLKISSPYPFAVRHAAIYRELFEEEKDVPAFAKMQRWQMKELAEDFFKLASGDVVKEGANKYVKFRDFYWEGDDTLVLPREAAGTFLVHYYAYPPEITSETPDDYELVLDPEVAAALPLYIASELMEDDDASLASYFRDQYELAKSNLLPSKSRSKAEFVNEKGW